MAEYNATQETLDIRLRQFQHAATSLAVMLELAENVELADYPSELPSFDELANAVQGIGWKVRPKPALSHDQCTLIAAEADRASIGGQRAPITGMHAELHTDGDMTLRLLFNDDSFETLIVTAEGGRRIID